MFLRRHRKKIDNVAYEYWSLCRTVRTTAGPRQEVVATLGKLGDDEVNGEAARGWDDLRVLLEGPAPIKPVATKPRLGPKPKPHQPPPALPEPPAPKPDQPRWEVADVANLRTERVRDFGLPWLALSLWHRLGLPKLLAELIEPGREDIPWGEVAAVLTTARFCGQLSELSICEHWYDRTALADITGLPSDKINDDRLYRGLDALQAHKDKLCGHLMDRYRDMFGTRFEFLIYDVTSTFFEGSAAGIPKAARGYSRDQRGDCKQVCIGLVCTPEGLPLSFEVYAGNRTDVTTVEEIVTNMEQKYGQTNRVWVMDRGMVSEKNIDFLRKRNARYLVGAPKSQLKHFEQQLLETTSWTEVQNGLEARLVKHPDGGPDEQYVLCRSTDRAKKELAMLANQCGRLTGELAKINAALRKKPTEDIESVSRRIGRWLGKYPAAAKVIEATLQRDAEGRAIALQITSNIAKGRELFRRHGAYLLRTNCDEQDPAQIWRWYVQLTQAEAAFRTAKSDLNLRPIYHQLGRRVEAHILVCFLALAQRRVLEQWMESRGLGTCAGKFIEEISAIKSMDVILPVKRGEQVAELRIRTVARPESRVAELLLRLGLELPERNRILETSPPRPPYKTLGEAAAEAAKSQAESMAAKM